MTQEKSETSGFEAFDPLLFDVKFALAKSVYTPKKFRIADAEALAKDVIAHLRLCRWRIEKIPPIAGNGAGDRPVGDSQNRGTRGER
jgi:hypothetical protein